MDQMTARETQTLVNTMDRIVVATLIVLVTMGGTAIYMAVVGH